MRTSVLAAGGVALALVLSACGGDGDSKDSALPGGDNGARLRRELAQRNLRLPILGGDDDTANRQYVKHIVLDHDSLRLRGVPSDRDVGRPHGLEWAEQFHWIGPAESRLEEYIARNATPL